MEKVRRFSVQLTGAAPILHSKDDVEAADALKLWREDPANQKDRRAGDDRSPAWTWMTRLYHDGKVVGIPCDNIMRCLMEAGAMVPVPGGKNGKTFKAQSQSGMLVHEELWPMLVDGKEIPVKKLEDLRAQKDFEAHQQRAQSLGFMLFVKRAKPQGAGSKHVRVRARFDRWAASGTVDVTDDKITLPVLRDMFSLAGTYKGLGDWRPSSPKSPGPFGRFTAVVKEI